MTRSGSNQVRGSAFYYLRNDRFDSKNAFESVNASKKGGGAWLRRSLRRDVISRLHY